MPAQAHDPVRPRVVGVLFLLGSFIGLLSVLLPHPPGSDDDMLLASMAVSFVTGAVFLAAARHIPPWLVHLSVAGVSVLVCAAIFFSGLVAGVYTTMFFWVALLSAFFFSRLEALLHLAWVLLCYAGVLAVVDSAGYSPFTRWLLSAITLSVTTLLTSWLVARRREAEERSERFFNLSRDMLCTASVDGYLVELNPAWTATLGYSPAELSSHPFLEFVHPEDRERTAAEAARIFDGEASAEFENRYRARDGSWHWLLWSSTLSPEQGLVYARATDVTERKRLETEREELVKELDSQARTDPLTRLPNRRRFFEELERELARAERQGLDLCLALIDLDRFKLYNDATATRQATSSCAPRRNAGERLCA